MDNAKTINSTPGILLAVIGNATTLKRKNAEELAGPCPLPGCSCDDDGFIVWPNAGGGGRYICRGCGNGHSHTVVDYVMRRDNVDFKEAVNQLSPFGNSEITAKPKPQTKTDREKWTEKANELWKGAAGNLWSEDGWKAVQWLEKRGLSFQTQIEAGLGYIPADLMEDPAEWGLPAGKPFLIPRGITIPCRDNRELHYIKIRRPIEKPKYLGVTGGSGWLFGSDTFKKALSAFLFESELDALLAYQFLPGVGCASLPAGNLIHPEWQPIFDPIEDLIIAYDQDAEGKKAAAKLKQSIPAFHLAGPLPSGKDLTEFYLSGGDVLDWLLGELERMGKEDG